MSRGDGGAAFKVGDRVEVIGNPDGSEPDGSCGGRYFRIGSTGTIVVPLDAVVRFDEPAGLSQTHDWFVHPKCLRLAARKEES